MKIDILDCTLRDGGYVNNWEFDNSTALDVIDGLYESGVRWIELGIMGKNPNVGKQTKFSEFNQILPLLKCRKKDCHYAVMLTTSLADEFTYPMCSSNTPDVIRVAYFKNELSKTYDIVKKLKNLGYTVFMQAMATFMYDSKELEEMIRNVNEIHPEGFYVVDSFGTMYPHDVIKICNEILCRLDKNIILGFHAHNNIQMAFSNVQEFIRLSKEHDIMIDGSIFGMGRGAGNVPIELIMNYLNKNYSQKYNFSTILDVFQRHISKIYEEKKWGYSMQYFLSSIYFINSSWGWFFINRGVDDLILLDKAYNMIPLEWKYTLNVSIGEKILESLLGEE